MTRQSTATPPREAPASAEPSTKPRILIVDDEPSMREMLRIVLRRDGYDVTVAANGTEAIDILQRDRMDMLLSDIRMPDVSGVEVLRVAKEANKDLVAFMTSGPSTWFPTCCCTKKKIATPSASVGDTVNATMTAGIAASNGPTIGIISPIPAIRAST